MEVCLYCYNLELQSATELVETLCPKADALLTSRGEIKLSFPHPLHAMLCHCSSYLYKTTKTATLNEGEWGGRWTLLFSVVITLVEYNASIILLPIVVS